LILLMHGTNMKIVPVHLALKCLDTNVESLYNIQPNHG
jgi:hypothetical protein